MTGPAPDALTASREALRRGDAWLFVLAPLAGGVLAALYFYPGDERAPETTATSAVPPAPEVDGRH